MPIVAKVRAAGIRAELYPDSTKMKKQMAYANAKQIPFVALAGDNEMAEGKITLKNMATGESTPINLTTFVSGFYAISMDEQLKDLEINGEAFDFKSLFGVGDTE
jgi:histidyl-tRNA synthetase